MRDARQHLEDQVGGLIRREHAWAHHDEPPRSVAPEAPRYELTRSTTATIRATRADDQTNHRAA